MMRSTTLILVAFGILTSFVLSFLFGKTIIPVLKRFKIKQTILDYGPSWHKSKQGTPTMGGIIFILSIVLSCLIFIPIYHNFYMSDLASNGWVLDQNSWKLNLFTLTYGILAAISFGLIGFWDDYIKITKKQNLGLTPRQKLVLQFLVSFLFLFIRSFTQILYGYKSITTIKVPFFHQIDLGAFYWILGAIFIVGTVNAVNLTDGIDGLNTSVTFFSSLSLMALAFITNNQLVEILLSTLLGACAGFFVYNAHPAKVFMGDTGSLFLGGILCAVSFLIEAPFFLIIIGSIYYIEMFSVILQVLYFKVTKGKRLFKMTPIHHHFELLEFTEKKICTIFSIATCISGLLAVLLFLYT